MGNQNHVVKKFSLQLQMAGNQNYCKLQKNCVKMVEGQLLAEIDTVLSNAFHEDAIIRIKRIEIDLGEINIDQVEADFVNRCIVEFTNKIETLSQQKSKDKEDAGVTVVSYEENCIQHFLHFMLTGKVSRSSDYTDFEKWQAEIIRSIKTNPAGFKIKCTQMLQSKPALIERLILQFDDVFINELIFLYHDKSGKEYDDLIMVFQKIAGKQKTPGRKNVLMKLLPQLFGVYNNKMESVNISKEMIDFNGVKKDSLQIANSFKDIKKEESLTPEVSGNAVGDTLKFSFISNAGLVILHPFLTRFFAVMDLIQENKFKDVFSKQKAVQLLQYLVSKEVQVPEYMLTLNKILCGVENGDYINRFIQLEEKEIREAEELLDAVAVHWTALKNTSVAAMQETFFQRNGKLSFDDIHERWKLQIEKKPVDILLDKISWGISYIQLPWMKYPLVTEW